MLVELLLHGNLKGVGRRISKETIETILVDIFIASAGIDPAVRRNTGTRFLSPEATAAIVEAQARATQEITWAEKRSKHQLRRTLSFRSSIPYCFAEYKLLEALSSKKQAQLESRVSQDV